MRLRQLAALLLGTPTLAIAQTSALSGHVVDAVTRRGLSRATVSIEGTALSTITDSTGIFKLATVPRGPHVLRATRLGYAPNRLPIVVAIAQVAGVEILLAQSALELRTVNVTADAVSRARGELGTASVIETEAIRNQMAASLAGILELIPGVVLQAPGLDGPQQISLRSVPVSGGGFSSTQSATTANPSAEQLAAFGTQIVLDGVPLSNNANLQTLGVRGELSLSSVSGGGVDLRRVPAATLDRVEVIRGVPSARYGDVTQGLIIVDTRAGAFEPQLTARFDARTAELAFAGGRTFARAQTASVTSDLARTIVAPGLRDDRSYRLTTGIAHRLNIGGAPEERSEPTRGAVFDTRFDVFRVFQDDPGTPPAVDIASFSHDAGLRFSERARVQLSGSTRVFFTGALEAISQHSFTQAPRVRGAMPFTNSLTPGRAIGKFIGGIYLSRVNVDGEPRHLYTRTELTRSIASLFGASHELRAGVELRREWTSGPGYQFDIEFPPQVEFNGVQGYDRPRRYDAVPPVATTGLYWDDWLTRTLFGSTTLQVQGGLRLDLLHRGTTWVSGARDAVLQPRLNAELSPAPWLRMRAGVGRMAKMPAFADLFPAPQYNDVVNVNWYANDPAERLAVLTTFVFDPTNPDLRYSTADRAEAGVEMDLGRSDTHLAVVAYADRLNGGVGISAQPTYILRDHYQLTDSTAGSGKPPQIIEPPSSRDTVPILIDRRANNLTLKGSGMEATLTLPEVPRLRTRASVQGAFTRSRLENSGVEFANAFSDFQLTGRGLRSPYWLGTTRTGERLLLTTRLIHHQPAIGLVITGTIQHTLREIRRDEGGTDTLSWSGYITHAGVLVPVPASQRADPQYTDIRLSRNSLLVDPQKTPVDWMFNLQVSKTVPYDGRFSFYAFNAFDRIGTYGGGPVAPLLFPPTRFGLELSMPFGGGRGGAQR
jgi:hypothetical protein